MILKFQKLYSIQQIHKNRVISIIKIMMILDALLINLIMTFLKHSNKNV